MKTPPKPKLRATKLEGVAPETTLEEAQRRIDSLTAENRVLGESLQETQAQLAGVEQAARAAVLARQKAEQAAQTAKQEADEHKKAAAELRKANQQLTVQVKRLAKQVEKTPLHPLTPEEASALLERTLQTFRAGTAFEVRDVNLTLKIATGKLGEEAVLVFPEPGAVDPATLHELKISLRGPGGLPETKPASS